MSECVRLQLRSEGSDSSTLRRVRWVLASVQLLQLKMSLLWRSGFIIMLIRRGPGASGPGGAV
jgi:hypothetical protein